MRPADGRPSQRAGEHRRARSDPGGPLRHLQRVAQQGRTEALVSLCRRSIRLIPDESPSAATSTHLGGRPLLAADARWPRTLDGRPLSLVAQIDCAPLAPLVPTEPLPARGALSFFYDADEQPWGFDPADADGWAVRHTADAERAVRHEFPGDLADDLRFVPVPLRPRLEWTFVPDPSYDAEQAGLVAYSEAYERVMGEEGSGALSNRLLGHPDRIQGDMQLECQLASNGLDCGGVPGDGDPRTASLTPGAADWRLLLQVDSEPLARMTWGDIGRLYWWLRAEDLQAGRWEAAWLVQQCY